MLVLTSPANVIEKRIDAANHLEIRRSMMRSLLRCLDLRYSKSKGVIYGEYGIKLRTKLTAHIIVIIFPDKLRRDGIWYEMFSVPLYGWFQRSSTIIIKSILTTIDKCVAERMGHCTRLTSARSLLADILGREVGNERRKQLKETLRKSLA